MSRPLRILARARTDVEDIFNWLVVRSATGAVSWYAAFVRTMEKMRSDPESYGLAPESHVLRRELRQALFKTPRGRRYRIIFLLDVNEVIVLRVRGPGQAPLRRRDLPSE